MFTQTVNVRTLITDTNPDTTPVYGPTVKATFQLWGLSTDEDASESRRYPSRGARGVRGTPLILPFHPPAAISARWADSGRSIGAKREAG
jgi:hypothetical protein